LGAGVTRDDLDAWVLATAPRAVAYAQSLLRHREQAEDVVQDCYYRLLRKADDYDLPRDGLKLLLKAISNACINVRTRERTLRTLDPVGPHSEVRGCGIVDQSVEEPERVLMTQELERAVERGLARLPVPQRAALELKSAGHSLEEIAMILEIRAGHAGVLVHRARKAMAEMLYPYVGDTAR
jgi:RNA polymerase sigma-70 factor (ECF subfamily)